MIGTCGECGHWGSMVHDEKSGEYVAPCRAKTPLFVFGVERGCWPITEMYDRCGEWQAIEEVKPTADPAHTAEPNCPCLDCIPF